MPSTHLLALTFILTGASAQLFIPPCDQNIFDSNVDNCLSDFNKSMEASGHGDQCPWPHVKSTYIKLKSCVDDCAIASWCKGHRSLVDGVFLEVHRTYFSLCSSPTQVHDPPLFTLIMLVAPGIITTLLLPILCTHLATYSMDATM